MIRAPTVDSPDSRTAESVPLISVIVPFRNASRWLRDCLKSLQNQDLPDASYEIVAVDNGSSDDSAAIVSDYPSVRLLRESRVGAYAARNLGVVSSRGSILAFTDADCVVRQDWLRRIAATLKGPDVQLVLGQRTAARDSGLLTLWSQYERLKEIYVFTSDELDLYYGHTNNMAVRRSAFEAHGPFLERLRGADTIFVRRLVDALGKKAVVFEPSVQVRHLELTGSRVLLQKLFIYGRSSTLYNRVVKARPLAYGERWNVFRETANSQNYSFVRTITLLGFLVAGVIAWQLGAASARLRIPAATR